MLSVTVPGLKAVNKASVYRTVYDYYSSLHPVNNDCFNVLIAYQPFRSVLMLPSFFFFCCGSFNSVCNVLLWNNEPTSDLIIILIRLTELLQILLSIKMEPLKKKNVVI